MTQACVEFIFKEKKIYLFLATLSLRCCTGVSLIALSGNVSLVVACELTVMASLAAEHGLYCVWASVVVAGGFHRCVFRALHRRLNSCGIWSWLLHGMWDLPGLGLKPMYPALAGRFFTTQPPRKPVEFTFEV